MSKEPFAGFDLVSRHTAQFGSSERTACAASRPPLKAGGSIAIHDLLPVAGGDANSLKSSAAEGHATAQPSRPLWPAMGTMSAETSAPRAFSNSLLDPAVRLSDR